MIQPDRFMKTSLEGNSGIVLNCDYERQPVTHSGDFPALKGFDYGYPVIPMNL